MVVEITYPKGAAASPPSIGGTITGGTTGSVLFVGPGPVFAQDNADFFWDNTANANYLRIGSGTSPGEIRLLEGSGGGTNYTGFKSPATLAANVAYTLPTADGSSNQFLQTNGSKVLNWASALSSISIGTPIGSSTSGSVLYVNSSNQLAQDNANFFWDATNHRLGLGTASPNQQLELTGNLRLAMTTPMQGIVYSGTDTFLHTYSGTAGVFNTFVGVGAGNLTNTSTTVGRNTAVGENALHSLADGYQNSVFGKNAGLLLTDGYSNTIIGYSSGFRISTGFQNTAVGGNSLASVTTGANNNAFGYNALFQVSSGSSNLGVGYTSNASVTTGNSNVGIGDNSLNGLSTGNNNTAVGVESLKCNSPGTIEGNTCIGYLGMNRTTTAQYNVGIGMQVLNTLSTGSHNIAVGYVAGSAIQNITTASYNTFLGDQTGFNSTTQYSYATAIGAGSIVEANNAMVLGAPDGGTGAVSVSIGIITPLSRLHLPAGTATANTAPLKLTTGTVLTTPELGAVEYDTNNFYLTKNSALRESILGVIFTQTSTQTVSNVGETTLIGSGIGTTTIPANTFVAGKTIRIMGAGVFSTQAVPGNVTIKIYIGATVIATGTITNILALASNNAFDFIAEITCRTTGASGSVMVNGKADYDTGTLIQGELSLNNAGATTTIDTTASKKIDVTLTWATASASNTISTTTSSFEILN